MFATDCYSNPAILNASSGAGYVTNVGGLTSYVTGSPFSMVAILFVSDIYDKVAKKQRCRCVCPDLLYGDPFDPENTSRPLPVWLKDHDPKFHNWFWKKFPLSKLLVFAGVTATYLGKAKHVKAIVLPHPAYLQVDDLRGMKAPIAILGGQNDTITPPNIIKQFKQVLQNTKPKVDNLVKIFPNVAHGWTVRYDPNDPKAVKAAEKAHQIMIDWFDKHRSKVRNLVM